MRLKFVYWFTFYNLYSPSVRYRAYYPLDYLRIHDQIPSFLVIPGYSPKRVFLFLRAYLSALFFRKRGSLIVVQRVKSNFIYANALKLLVLLRRKNTIFDLDDADFLEASLPSLSFFARKCSYVTVGSHHLLFLMKTMNEKIVINTTAVPDLDRNKQWGNSVFHVGWIGDYGGEHKEVLYRDLFPALRTIPIKIKLSVIGVKTKADADEIISYFRQSLNIECNIPLEFPWLDEFLVQMEISTFDVGIATLMDSDMHKSKSAFKTKQYLNNGVPVLSPDLPENNYFVLDGENGYYCEGPEQFRARILQIAEMSREERAAFSESVIRSRELFDTYNYNETLKLIFS